MASPAPDHRVRRLNDGPLRADGDYVLYWMVTNRRTSWNWSLDHAVAASIHLRKPLLILEALWAGYPWASDRFHAFLLQSIEDNKRVLAGAPVRHYAYVEPRIGAGRGLVETLAVQACLIVTDDYPCFKVPQMTGAVASRVGVRVEAVDSNGLLPLRQTERAFLRAFDFRRFQQRHLPLFLEERPSASPVRGAPLPLPARAPSGIRKRWPEAQMSFRRAEPRALASLPIDHEVRPVDGTPGGQSEARRRWRRFLSSRIDGYHEQARHPDAEATSGLSPYLHFGNLSAHEVFWDIQRRETREGWRPADVDSSGRGSRDWWGMRQATCAFLEQLVIWRELGFNFCAHRNDYASFDSLPGWARRTLESHRSDPRPKLYAKEDLEGAATADPIWNAAQRQLLGEGKIHNSLRMLWGKKILEWSADAETAAATMIELNDRFALDGRDPSSYAGIYWVLGRYDRAWGPERPIFGTVRYMSSDAARRKLRLRRYLDRWGNDTSFV